MSELRIITNNVPRPIVQAWELTAAEREEFDYLDWGAIERGEGSREFVRYRGETYDLDDCEGAFPPDRRWFYRSDSFFSGVLFRYPPHEDERRISELHGEIADAHKAGRDPQRQLCELADLVEHIDPDYIICGRYCT